MNSPNHQQTIDNRTLGYNSSASPLMTKFVCTELTTQAGSAPAQNCATALRVILERIGFCKSVFKFDDRCPESAVSSSIYNGYRPDMWIILHIIANELSVLISFLLNIAHKFGKYLHVKIIKPINERNRCLNF